MKASDLREIFEPELDCGRVASDETAELLKRHRALRRELLDVERRLLWRLPQLEKHRRNLDAAISAVGFAAEADHG